MTDTKIKPKHYSATPSVTRTAKKALKALALGGLAASTTGAAALGNGQNQIASWDGASSHGRALKQISLASPTPSPTPAQPSTSAAPAHSLGAAMPPRVVFPVTVIRQRRHGASLRRQREPQRCRWRRSP